MHMMISDEQVQLALAYLHGHGTDVPQRHVVEPDRGITPEFVERVKRELALMPETRVDRVADARDFLSAGVDHGQVADKMLGRIVSDSLR